MKKFFFILAIFASLLVGAGAAGAYSRYWENSGSIYFCRGNPSYAVCKLKGTNFEVDVMKMKDGNTNVSIFNGDSALFSCSRWPDPVLGRCVDYRD